MGVGKPAPVQFVNTMGKGTKVSVKVKGTAKGVRKALSQIVSDMPAKEVTYREADFRERQKRQADAK
jgi:hypothetical protein